MAKQTFEIIDGVYAGPKVWEGPLNLRVYKDTLISLGPLTKVDGDLWLRDCTNLVSLGSLMEVRKWLDLEGCSSLASLGELKEVERLVDLTDCASLTSLGPLTKVGGWLRLEGCSSLASLGDLKEVRDDLVVLGNDTLSLQDVQEKVLYYTSLLAHEALSALHTEEVQKVPLFKNILLQTLQGG